MDIQDYIDNGSQVYLTNVSIDIAILGYQEKELKILLYEHDDKWGLVGGHIKRTESTSDASARILLELTGLQNQYLRLFHVFGDKNRNFAKEFRQILQKDGYEWRKDQWINERFISIAYYALVDIDQTHPRPGLFIEKMAWHNAKDLPNMLMDHGEIVKRLLEQLRLDIQFDHISAKLLPEEFSMPELQSLHETILDKKLERSRFQKKMLSLNIYERLPKLKQDAPRRKPYLYRLKEEE